MTWSAVDSDPVDLVILLGAPGLDVIVSRAGVEDDRAALIERPQLVIAGAGVRGAGRQADEVESGPCPDVSAYSDRVVSGLPVGTFQPVHVVAGQVRDAFRAASVCASVVAWAAFQDLVAESAAHAVVAALAIHAFAAAATEEQVVSWAAVHPRTFGA